MIIGDLKRFGIEVLCEDFASELGDVFICVSGRRVSSAPVYFPTFVSELHRFMKLHESLLFRTFDFSGLRDEEAFALLHSVLNEEQVRPNLTASDVFNYYRMHSLDDAVDGWEIYVFEVANQTHIVCRELTFPSDPELTDKRIWSAGVPSIEFTNTIAQFVNLFQTSL